MKVGALETCSAQPKTQKPQQPQHSQAWSWQSEATVQDTLDDVDWDMFQTGTDSMKFADVAVSFVCMLEN